MVLFWDTLSWNSIFLEKMEMRILWKLWQDRLMSQLKEPKAKSLKISLSGRAFSVLFSYCAFDLWEHTRTDNRQRQAEKRPLEEEKICLIEDKVHRNKRKIVTHNTKGSKGSKIECTISYSMWADFSTQFMSDTRSAIYAALHFYKRDIQPVKMSQKDDFLWVWAS